MVGLVAASLLLATAPAHAVNDPAFDKQWGMTLIGAPNAWATGRGAGITIAVVDTGVHLTHEDLKDKILPGRNIIDPSKPPQDDDGHGTHVAGIAAAETDNGRGVVGVAPDARILPVKVLDANGMGSSADVAAGIRYAADQHAQIINLSLGDVAQSVFGPTFTDAVEYAWSKGSICVVAAGNSYITSSGYETQDAVVVSSVDRNDQRPTYSSGVGKAKWGIAAPGGAGTNPIPDSNDIFSSWWYSKDPSATNYYAYDAGTSMAAPHVSGALAVLRGLGLDPAAAIDRLLSTAKDIGTAGKDPTFGYGRLDVAKAVSGLGSRSGQTATTASGGGRTTRTTRRSTGGSTGGTAPKGTAASTTSPTTAAVDPGAGTTVAEPATGSPGAADTPRRLSPEVIPRSSRDRPWAAAAAALVLLVVSGSMGSSAARRARPRPG